MQDEKSDLPKTGNIDQMDFFPSGQLNDSSQDTNHPSDLKLKNINTKSFTKHENTSLSLLTRLRLSMQLSGILNKLRPFNQKEHRAKTRQDISRILLCLLFFVITISSISLIFGDEATKKEVKDWVILILALFA